MYERGSRRMDFREILYLHVYGRDTPNLVKIGENLGLLLEYLITLVLVLHYDKSAKEIHCFIYMASLNTFIFLTATCTSPTIQGNVLLSFHGNNGKANASPF